MVESEYNQLREENQVGNKPSIQQDALSNASSTPLTSLDSPRIFFMRGISTPEPRRKRVASFFYSVFNTANAALGTGVLCFPYAFKQSGWLLGSIITVVFAFIIGYSLTIILRCARAYNCGDYQKLVCQMYGYSAGQFLTVAILILQFLTCVAYLLVMGTSINSLAADVKFLSKNVVMALCGLAVFPVCCLRTMEKLGFTSFLGVIAVWFTVGMIIVDGIRKGKSYRGNAFNEKPSMIQTFPLVMFALFCQITVVPATEELRIYWPSKSRPGKIRYKTLVLVCTMTMLMCTLVYIPTGIFGIFLFGDEVKANILENYNEHTETGAYMPNTWALKVSRLCMALTTFFGYPVILWINRGAYFDLMGTPVDGVSDKSFYGFTLVHILVSVGIAILLNLANLDIDFVMSIVGATVGVVIQLIFPGFMLISLGDKIKGYVVLVLAAFISVLGVAITIIQSACPENPSGGICKAVLG